MIAIKIFLLMCLIAYINCYNLNNDSSIVLIDNDELKNIEIVLINDEFNDSLLGVIDEFNNIEIVLINDEFKNNNSLIVVIDDDEYTNNLKHTQVLQICK